jgi:hypothetical protein
MARHRPVGRFRRALADHDLSSTLAIFDPVIDWAWPLTRQ